MEGLIQKHITKLKALCLQAIYSTLLMCLFLQSSHALEQCQNSVLAEKFTTYNADRLQTLQRGLNSVGYGLTDDGTLGDATLAALSGFCESLVIVGKAANTADQISSEVIFYSGVSVAHPDWRDLMESEEFSKWLGEQSEDIQTFIKDAVTANRVQPIAVFGEYIAGQNVFFVISEADLEKIGAHKEALEKLNELINIGFESKIDLLNELIKLLKPVDDNYESVINSLQPQADENDSYKLNQDLLNKIVTDLGLLNFSDDIVNNMTLLQDIVFSNQSLFLEAVSQAGTTEVTSSEREEIANLAKKQSYASSQDALAAIKWTGDGCGCAPLVGYGERYQTYIYGFYPFWQSQFDSEKGDEAVPVDFSVLTRIGYYALTIDDDFSISDVRHWRKERAYSQFIQEAQKHQTQMDIVVYDNSWGKWAKEAKLEEQGESPTQELVDQITGMLSEKLDNYAINILKPYISFGTHSIDTIGDGITLKFDFDLENVEEEEQQTTFKYFKTFIHTLRQSLDNKALEVGENHFAINLFWPMDKLEDKNGFYRLTNFMQLEKDVDLFLLPLKDYKSPTASLKELRKSIDTLKILDSVTVLNKLVPLINPSALSTDQLESVLRYSDWNYSGVGLWAMPLNSELSTVLRTTMVDLAVEDQGLIGMYRKAEQYICSQLCPNRWVVRLVLFSVGLILLGYFLISIRVCCMRKIYDKWYFIAAIGVYLFIFTLTLVCDPFFNRYQGIIFFVIFLVTIAVIWFLRRMKFMEKSFP